MAHDQDFAATLKRLMEREHLTVGALAKRSKLTARSIENWLDGRAARPRDPFDLLRLARGLALDANGTDLLLLAAAKLSLARVIEQAQQSGDEGLNELVGRWQTSAVLPSPEATRYEAKYRKLLAGELERLETFGIPQVESKTKKQQVSVAYVTLSAEVAPLSPDHKMLLGRRGRDEEESERVVRVSGPVDRMLSHSKRLLLIGDAGSGKTTLLQWIALQCAGQQFAGELASWNSLVPFFIRLRAVRSSDDQPRGFPSVEELPFVNLPNDEIGPPPEGWVRSLLDSGRALVLVDGVDELPQTRRELMLESLRRLVDFYPHARYIITSRPLREQERTWEQWEEWLAQTEVVRGRLQEMSRTTIDLFVDYWYRALLPTCRAAERAEVEAMPVQLKQVLRARLPLIRLATNPLLCAMICALFYDKGENLPSERVELYRDCIEMLLQRDSGRKIDRGPHIPRLKLPQQRLLIQQLAAQLSRSGVLEVAAAAAADILAGPLDAMEVPESTTGDGVLLLFLVNKLLQAPVEDHVEFTHRSFQEYLTAAAIQKAGAIDELLRHIDDDLWRETIVLAAGMTSAEQSERLLRGVLDGGSPPFIERLSGAVRRSVSQEARSEEKQRERRRLALALACLETCLQLPRPLRKEILERSVVLFPPTDHNLQRDIASLGDSAVERLAPQPDYTEKEVAGCIRTLGLIGSKAALTTLERYIDPPKVGDWSIARAFGAAWVSFDPSIYGERVVSRLRRIALPPEVALATVIPWLKHIEELWVAKIDDTETELVAQLQQLKYLDLSGTQVSDLGPLAQLQQLEYLYLTRTQVSDLGPLAQLQQLEHLDLDGIQVSDLGPLAQLQQLKRLDIDGTQVSDLGPLANLRSLQTLYISRQVASKNRALLNGLPNLDVIET